MSDYKDIADRFARETAQHQLAVLHDDGLYRHLRFANPAGGFYRFDLITWPHNLMIRADGASFAFSIYPTEDWFDVVRRTAHTGEINPGYWEGKITAGRSDTRDYSMDLLKEQIKDTVKAWIDDDLDHRIAARAGVECPHKLPVDVREHHAKAVKAEHKAFARKIRAAVHKHFYSEDSEYNVEHKSEAERALADFCYDRHYTATCACGETWKGEYHHDAVAWRERHLRAFDCGPSRVGADPVKIEQFHGYQFEDFCEWQLTDFSWQYLWACHAIAWGVPAYIAARKAVAA